MIMKENVKLCAVRYDECRENTLREQMNKNVVRLRQLLPYDMRPNAEY
jgi:hypothetical protein